MKFVADVMLGSLARLMRFHGYDVEYDNQAEDVFLLKRSRYRIVLTKDRVLSESIRNGNVYLVRGVGGRNQIQEIRKEFPAHNTRARCVECNAKLRVIRKQRVEHLIPPFVFQKHESFFHCRFCRRVYWTGTHFERMRRMLE